ncbi:MAG: hypothetical protein ABIU63_10925 [Chitinophagaceae bacterium]
MPVKINDATINRPEGSRIIDAPAVLIDLNAFVTQLKEETAWGKNDRNGITVFKTPGMTIVLTALHKGASIDGLLVEGILTLQVIEGSVSIDTEDNSMTLSAKQMVVLHPASKQNVTAQQDAVLLLTNTHVSG